jgi:RNA-directed DNA polymerase
MSREVQVRFCESRAVRSRPATHLVVHCDSEDQARRVVADIAERMNQVGLQLHPDKTQIVYCKDNNRRGIYPHTAFTFLGYTFRPRPSRDRQGHTFLAFLPAISPQALRKISRQVRRWRLHRWIYHTFGEVARTINPVVAGWMQYYGRFYPSALYRLLARINAYLVRWIRNKYRRYDATRAARRKLAEITSEYPRLFRHWRWVTTAY